MIKRFNRQAQFAKWVKTLTSHQKGLLLRSITLTALLVVALILSTYAIIRYFEADEISLPPGYSPLEYAQALSRADANNDGTINLFDYALAMQDEYGTQNSFQISDANNDTFLNAIDTSFIISHVDVQVDSLKTDLFNSSRYRDQINREIARRNEDNLPHANLDNSVMTVTSEEGGSDPQYGTSIIPKTLGTVSSYTGSATFDYPIEVPRGPGGVAPSLSISYSSASVDDARNNGTDGGKPFYVDSQQYIPSQMGHGFALGGIGSIIRDTKDEKEVYKLKGELYHRFILNIPGNVSAELRYNPSIGRWTSTPHAFLKIEHRQPEKINYGETTYMDPSDWEVTTPDGTRYFFGEKDVSEKFNSDGRIHGSEDVKNEKGELIGTKNGNAYVEFDKAHMCEGKSETDPCKEKEKKGKVALVTKWLLRKVVTTDGKEISYVYDSQQKYLGKPWNGTPIAFVSSTSFPREILWNDGKHRVVFQKEDRPDKGFGEYMRSRIKKIRVETKLEADGAYHLVRSYVLSYYDDNSAASNKEKLGVKIGEISNGDPIDNEFRASLLTSIQKFGSDDTTSEPRVTFRYAQYRFAPQGYHGGEIYVSSINNGLGGETRFAYQPYGVQGLGPKGAVAGGLNWRVRVIQKEVHDLVQDKKSRIDYEYSDPKLYVEVLRKAPTGEGGAAVEFLGHAKVELKSYDFDNSLLARTEVFFNQANSAEGCFEPHPAKGQSSRSITYAGETDLAAQESTQTFKYRHNGVYGQDVSSQCDWKRTKQPLFVYPYESLTIARESQKNLIPEVFASKVSFVPKNEIRTLQKTLSHDDFGNVLKAVAYGEVDTAQKDLDPADNRYSYSYYLTSGSAWIKNLPYLSYTSMSDSCGAEDISCQWGRSKSYYDHFDNTNLDLTYEEMQPRYGFLTQKETWMDDSKRTVSGFEYWDISGNTEDDDKRKGSIFRIYGPRPNLKEIKNIKEEVMLLSEKKFDDYYDTLLVEEKNALGHVSRIEKYDYLHQVPQRVSQQIQVSPPVFAVSTMDFDQLGRLIAQFGPDPEKPGQTLAEPIKVNHFFERAEEGMVARSAALVSQTTDGKKHYQISDSFYDGSGQVYQSQILSSIVDGKDMRKVSDNEYHADGKVSRSFEIQTSDPITLDVNSSNYQTILSSVQPQYIAGVSRVVSAETTYDKLRRPISSTTIETGTNQRYTSKTEYALLASKSVDSKGIEKIVLNDVWGRGLYAFTMEASQQKGLMTINEYSEPMLNKATKTMIIDTSGEKTESTNTFDKSGRLISSTEPSLGHYAFEYDVYGNKLLEVSQPREDVGFEYDVLGRLTKRVYYSLSSGEPYNKTVSNEIVWTYDNGQNGLGKLHKVEHLTGSKEFEYDSGQRAISTKVKTFDNEKVFSTSYNTLSQEVSSIYPDKTIVSKEYDREGRVLKMKIDGVETFTGAQYDKFGNQRVAGVVFKGNQYTSINKLDSLGRLTGLSMSKNDAEIFRQDLSYNELAEFTSLNDVVNGESMHFIYAYDGFSQLAAVSSEGYTSMYEYDLFGRMLMKKEKDVVTMKYTSEYPFFAPKRIEVSDNDEPQSIDVSYTKEGGMKSDLNNCYYYNREGELITLHIKKDKNAGCTEQNASRVYMFYYDEGGAMNFQEEYDPSNMTKPLKQLYLFGMYEEEITH